MTDVQKGEGWKISSILPIFPTLLLKPSLKPWELKPLASLGCPAAAAQWIFHNHLIQLMHNSFFHQWAFYKIWIGDFSFPETLSPFSIQSRIKSLKGLKAVSWIQRLNQDLNASFDRCLEQQKPAVLNRLGDQQTSTQTLSFSEDSSSSSETLVGNAICFPPLWQNKNLIKSQNVTLRNLLQP